MGYVLVSHLRQDHLPPCHCHDRIRFEKDQSFHSVDEAQPDQDLGADCLVQIGYSSIASGECSVRVTSNLGLS